MVQPLVPGKGSRISINKLIRCRWKQGHSQAAGEDLDEDRSNDGEDKHSEQSASNFSESGKAVRVHHMSGGPTRICTASLLMGSASLGSTPDTHIEKSQNPVSKVQQAQGFGGLSQAARLLAWTLRKAKRSRTQTKMSSPILRHLSLP